MRYIYSLALCALVCLLSAVAVADDAESDTDRRARELYVEGDTHYKAGRYEEAAELFVEAYEISKRPVLLFNVANAYERMGEYEKAASYLREYLKAPRVDDVVSVRERIRRLEAAEAERKREIERVKQEAAEAAKKNQPKPPSRVPAYVLFGMSGAATISAVVFGLAANSAGNDASASCSSRVADTPICLASAQDALDRETRNAIITDISIAVAVVSATAGIYYWIRTGKKIEALEQSSATSSAQLGPALIPGGVGLGLSGNF